MGLGYINTGMGAGGAFDLIVSVRYNAPAIPAAGAPPSVEEWRCMWAEMSNLLHEATAGRSRLRNVYYANNLAGSMAADFCLFANPAKGWHAPPQTCKPDAVESNFGSPGFAAFGSPNFDGHLSSYLALHEFGHSAFGLRDEYPHGCVGVEGGRAACIMEYGLAKNGAAVDAGCVVHTPPHTNKTRFCTPIHPFTAHPTEHLSGSATTNHQHDCHGVSCVQTIAAFTNALGHRIDILQTFDPVGPAPPINWIELDRPARFVLLLDRSLSMAANNAVFGVREAAKYWIDLEAMLGVGNRIAIIAYNHGLDQLWPTVGVKVADLQPGHVANAKAAVDAGVVAAGSTDIAGALAAARTRITPMPGATPDLAASQAIVLFTDGRQTVPGDPLDEVAALRARFIRVFPIGMGPDADIAKPVLQQIADGTEGTFAQILDPDAPIDPDDDADPVVKATGEILDEMIHKSAKLHSGLALVEETRLAEAGDPATYRFLVEEGATAVTIVVRHDANDFIDLAVAPPGEPEPMHPEAFSEILYTNPEGSPYALVVARDPEPGVWQVRVATTASTDASVKVFAFTSNPHFFVGLVRRGGDTDADPPPHLVARINYGGAVTNLTRALVRTPDGEAVAMFAEQPPGSGTYVARLPRRREGTYEYFADFAGDGTPHLVTPHGLEDPAPPPAQVPEFARLERVLVDIDERRTFVSRLPTPVSSAVQTTRTWWSATVPQIRARLPTSYTDWLRRFRR